MRAQQIRDAKRKKGKVAFAVPELSDQEWTELIEANLVWPKDMADCVTWKGRTDKRGYAQIYYDYRYWPVQRLIFKHFYGFDPLDQTVHHGCAGGRRACVDGRCLVALPKITNLQLDNGSQLTHCMRDHEFTEANTRVDRRGHRHCRTCIAERQRTSRANRKNQGLAA